MPRPRSRALAVFTGASLIVLLGLGGPPVLAAKKPASATSSLRALVRQTNALPAAAVSKAQRRRLTGPRGPRAPDRQEAPVHGGR